MTPQEPQETPGELPLPEEMPFQIVDMTTAPELPPAAADSAGDGSSKDDRRSRAASTRAPSADEWQEFLGGTVLRLLTEGYLYLVLFRHVDEGDLSPRELETIRLTREELCDMAAPMGSVAAKSKLGKKHGRTVIASAESYESLIDLFFWLKRVNKIASRYRPLKKKSDKSTSAEGEVIDGTVQGQDAGPGYGPGGAGNGGVPNVAGIVNHGAG